MRRKLLLFAALCILLFFIGVFMAAFTKNYKVALNSTLGNECVYIINEAVQYAMQKNGNLTEILDVEKNETGVISCVSVDHGMLNQLSLYAMEVLKDEMIGLTNIELSVPLGNMLGSEFLSGRGPVIRAEAFPQGGIGISYQTRFSDAGINQVLFHLEMVVKVEMETVFGLRHFYQSVERSVPVCDVVIVGNVPETYANLPAETDFLNLVP